MNIMRTNVKKNCDSTVMNYWMVEEIRKDIKKGKLGTLTIDEMVSRVTERRIGCGLNKQFTMNTNTYRRDQTVNVAGRLIRVSTPLDMVRPADIPSPSESKADCISLPSDSQVQREKERIAREKNFEIQNEKTSKKAGSKRA